MVVSMPTYISTAQFAARCRCSTQRVRAWLGEGRVAGALRLDGRTWLIPQHAPRPANLARGRRPLIRWAKNTRQSDRK